MDQYLTNTLTNGIVDRLWVLGVVGSIPIIRNKKLFRLSGIPRK